MPKDFRVAVLISGRGSNLEQLIRCSADSYKIVGVFSNRSDAPGLEFARSAQIPAHSFDRRDFASLAEQKQALYAAVEAIAPDLIALAGYMQIIEAGFVEKNLGKLINIHPSLLPAFPGLHTHRQALSAQVLEHGCTVHYVSEEVDAGPIIAQAKLEVSSAETEDSLSQRVLELEHRLYPWSVTQIARGEVAWHPSGVISVSQAARASAEREGFQLPVQPS